MKRMICLCLAALLVFTACSQYASPDVAELMDSVLAGQDVNEMTAATDAETVIIFDIDLDTVDEYSVYYSGRGGYADLVAIFKLNDIADVESVAAMLEEYKASRYEDFKGYAPIEAKKIESGRVLSYDNYVLLIILPDIYAAQDAVDAAFKV